jgi:AcrR family transcriptional regulator
MPRNKPELAREEKRQEILQVARRLFLQAGYEATSMGRIAEEAGVAPNTLYWYFTDKDALLIAVLNELVTEATREFQARKTSPLERQLVWLLGVFEGLQNIIATVHARVSASEALRVWHEQFHRMLEAKLHAELERYGVPAEDRQHAARVAMFVVEGLLAHPTSAKEQRELMRWLVSALERTNRA